VLIFLSQAARMFSFSAWSSFSPYNLKIFATFQIPFNDLLNPRSSALALFRACISDNAKSFPCMLTSRAFAEIVFSAHFKAVRTRDARFLLACEQ